MAYKYYVMVRFLMFLTRTCRGDDGSCCLVVVGVGVVVGKGIAIVLVAGAIGAIVVVAVYVVLMVSFLSGVYLSPFVVVVIIVVVRRRWR